jgi:hypothetical protein
MKITKTQLRQIIKEELLKEAGGLPGRSFGGTMADLDAEAKMRETDFLNPAEAMVPAAEEELLEAVHMAWGRAAEMGMEDSQIWAAIEREFRRGR